MVEDSQSSQPASRQLVGPCGNTARGSGKISESCRIGTEKQLCCNKDSLGESKSIWLNSYIITIPANFHVTIGQ